MFKNLLFALLVSASLTVSASAHTTVGAAVGTLRENTVQTGAFTMTYQTGIMQLHLNLPSKVGSVKLDILNFNGPGNYELSDGSTALASVVTPNGKFQTNTAVNGEVTITKFDIKQGIVEGTFTFAAQQNTKILKIEHTTFVARP